MRKWHYKSVILFLGLLLMALIYQSCEKVKEAEYVPTTPAGGGGTGGFPGGTGTEVVVEGWSDNAVESDVIRDPDCDDDPTTTDPELMYNDEDTVTLRNKTDKNIHIDSYTVDYTLIGTGATLSRYTGGIDLHLGPNSSGSASIYLVTLNTKLQLCPNFSTPCITNIPLNARAKVTFYGIIESDEAVGCDSNVSINFADYVVGCD